MEKNAQKEKKVKLMQAGKVIKKTKRYDESLKIFEKKKGKEKTHFLAR